MQPITITISPFVSGLIIGAVGGVIFAVIAIWGLVKFAAWQKAKQMPGLNKLRAN